MKLIFTCSTITKPFLSFAKSNNNCHNFEKKMRHNGKLSDIEIISFGMSGVKLYLFSAKPKFGTVHSKDKSPFLQLELNSSRSLLKRTLSLEQKLEIIKMGVFIKIFILGSFLLGIESIFTRYDIKHVSYNLWQPKETINGKR